MEFKVKSSLADLTRNQTDTVQASFPQITCGNKNNNTSNMFRKEVQVYTSVRTPPLPPPPKSHQISKLRLGFQGLLQCCSRKTADVSKHTVVCTNTSSARLQPHQQMPIWFPLEKCLAARLDTPQKKPNSYWSSAGLKPGPVDCRAGAQGRVSG